MRRRPAPGGELVWWCMFHPDETPPAPPDVRPVVKVPTPRPPAPPYDVPPPVPPPPSCTKTTTCPKPPKHVGRCVGPQQPPPSTLTGPCPRSAECDRGARHAGKCSKPKQARPAPVRGRTVQIPVRYTPEEAAAIRARASELGATLNDDLRARTLAGLTFEEGPP